MMKKQTNLAVVDNTEPLSDERQNLVHAQRRRAERSAAGEEVHKRVSLLCARKAEAESRRAEKRGVRAMWLQAQADVYSRWAAAGGEGEAPTPPYVSEIAQLDNEIAAGDMAIAACEQAIADLQDDARAAQAGNLDALANVNGAVVGVTFATFQDKANKLIELQRHVAAELADLLAFERYCVIEGHRGNRDAGVLAGEAGRIIHKCRQLEVVNPEAGVPKWTAFANRLFADATVEF